MRGKRLWQVIVLSASMILLLVSGGGVQAAPSAAPNAVVGPLARGWARVAMPGFGLATTASVSALEVYNNQLYAGTINWSSGGSIWRTSTGTDWQLVAYPGQVSNVNNPAITDMIVFGTQLYVGTAWSGQLNTQWNYQVSRYNGTTWETVIGGQGYPIHGFTTFEIFNNELYVGVFKSSDAGVGASIWKSPSGNTGSWQEVMLNGNGNPHAFAITGLKAFNGYLYAALGNDIDGANVVRSSDGVNWTTVVPNGFTGPCESSPGVKILCNWDTGGFAVFGNALYLGVRNEVPGATTPTSHGGVLYRTVDGTNWLPVTIDGFGDTTNTKIEGLVEYNGILYALTFNAQYWETPSTGIQVWASTDGQNFFPVHKGGFSSMYNTNSLWSNAQAVFNGRLFIGTSNKDPNNGGEVFMTVDNLTFLPMTSR